MSNGSDIIFYFSLTIFLFTVTLYLLHLSFVCTSCLIVLYVRINTEYIYIPDYRSLVTQTSGMDICQIRYDICEFDSLRGLGIDIIGRVHFDNRYRFVIWMGSIGKATEPCQQTSGCWHLTFDSFLNLDMGDDTNTKFYCFVYRQHIWLERWLLGYMIDHV